MSTGLSEEFSDRFSTCDRTPWVGDRLVGMLLSTYDKHMKETRTHIYVSSGIRTHDPKVQQMKS
jgi:hypothetical protein